MTNPPNPSGPSDRRHFSRVHFQHELTLLDQRGTSYPGAFNDISLKGMLFWCETLPPKGSVVTGTMPLGEEQLRICGQVLWADTERGAAIRFTDMDVESFSHLRRLVALNMGDSEKIDDEFFSSL
ncbi:MAG: PilZ domain-containing protein [Magnetococcales bacterium]|nr:PilZ domain-containing protein [Magnetococcales bacterium]MBF0156238.1 PilZ domain-containing protein [Magnetococcales bacterium]